MNHPDPGVAIPTTEPDGDNARAGLINGTTVLQAGLDHSADPNSLIGALNAEWSQVQPAVAAALKRWSTRHPILAVASFEPGEHITLSHGDADAYLLALLDYATGQRCDDRALAARTVLQLMLPSAAHLSRRMQPSPRNERESTVVHAMYEVITSYPTDRRPNRVAANITYDTLHRCRQDRRSRDASGRTREILVSEPELTVPAVRRVEQPTTASEELLRLLIWAVRRRVLTAPQAQLLSEGSSYGQTNTLAQQWSTTPEAVRQRRHSALVKLRRAITDYDAGFADLEGSGRPATRISSPRTVPALAGNSAWEDSDHE